MFDPKCDFQIGRSLHGWRVERDDPRGRHRWRRTSLFWRVLQYDDCELKSLLKQFHKFVLKSIAIWWLRVKKALKQLLKFVFVKSQQLFTLQVLKQFIKFVLKSFTSWWLRFKETLKQFIKFVLAFRYFTIWRLRVKETSKQLLKIIIVKSQQFIKFVLKSFTKWRLQAKKALKEFFKFGFMCFFESESSFHWTLLYYWMLLSVI